MHDILLSKLPNLLGKYSENKKLAHLTWFKAGGRADILFQPKNIIDLQYFLQNKPDIPVTILGAGSNLLIREGGVKGVVIKLGQGFNDIDIDNDLIYAGAATLDYHLSMYALEKEYKNFEFLSGIPGTVGGAIAMNAGSYGYEISDIVERIHAIDYQGNVCVIDSGDFRFSYRCNQLVDNFIFLGAWFRKEMGDRRAIENKILQIKKSREETQPIHTKTAGSSFKNSSDYQAWHLIEKAGCRGMKIGGAQISPLHCNFIINHDNASADDIENLIKCVQQKVYEKTGISLEPEIKIIGEKYLVRN